MAKGVASCPSCTGSAYPEDKYCRFCGIPLDESEWTSLRLRRRVRNKLNKQKKPSESLGEYVERLMDREKFKE